MCYFCDKCDYSTLNRSDWNRHLDSLKHLKKCMDDSDVEDEEMKYECKLCKYRTKKLSDIERHNGTKKHLNTILMEQKMEKRITEMIQEQLKQQMVNEDKPIMNTTTNNNTMNNSHNTNNTMINKNKFNLNIFLNEECKDAINMTDFINNITLTLKDLEQTAQLGYTAGITKIINDRVQEIGLHKRPYHCTDKKRETVYVKDANLWEKEQDDKPKMKKMIKKIIHKNLEQLSEWKSANPECTDLSNRKGEQYLNMMVEVNGGNHVEEKEVKILQNLTEMATLMKPL